MYTYMSSNRILKITELQQPHNKLDLAFLESFVSWIVRSKTGVSGSDGIVDPWKQKFVSLVASVKEY